MEKFTCRWALNLKEIALKVYRFSIWKMITQFIYMKKEVIEFFLMFVLWCILNAMSCCVCVCVTRTGIFSSTFFPTHWIFHLQDIYVDFWFSGKWFEKSAIFPTTICNIGHYAHRTTSNKTNNNNNEQFSRLNFSFRRSSTEWSDVIIIVTLFDCIDPNVNQRTLGKT